jgi:thiol-disulfide isomerase/thioredoxin
VLGTKTALIKNDFDKFKELNKNSKNWSEKLYDKLYNLIIDNSDNQYMGDLLAYYSNDTILDNNKLLTLYNKLDHNEQSLWSLEKIKKTIFPDSIAKIGNKFTDFSLVDTEGNTRNTNEFNGSIFLIDFWASWCAPCRKQNPEFINIYNEFHDKGFEILGVSIDTDKRKWIKAVKTDKLPWLNLIDKRGIKSPILIKYDAALGIPKNWLIDQNSKILESDLSPNELRSYLKQNL